MGVQSMQQVQMRLVGKKQSWGLMGSDCREDEIVNISQIWEGSAPKDDEPRASSYAPVDLKLVW